jgi:hypothetical protein
MNPKERSIAFFVALLLTFGINGLNFEYLDFKYNQLPYSMIGIGSILLTLFIVSRIRNR